MTRKSWLSFGRFPRIKLFFDLGVDARLPRVVHYMVLHSVHRLLPMFVGVFHRLGGRPTSRVRMQIRCRLPAVPLINRLSIAAAAAAATGDIAAAVSGRPVRRSAGHRTVVHAGMSIWIGPGRPALIRRWTSRIVGWQRRRLLVSFRLQIALGFRFAEALRVRVSLYNMS